MAGLMGLMADESYVWGWCTILGWRLALGLGCGCWGTSVSGTAMPIGSPRLLRRWARPGVLVISGTGGL